jgi:hypothetical protein
MSLDGTTGELSSGGQAHGTAQVQPVHLELSAYYGLAPPATGTDTSQATTPGAGHSPGGTRRATAALTTTDATQPSRQLVQEVLARASIGELLSEAQAFQVQALDAETALQRAALRLFEDYDEAARWCFAQGQVLAELRRSLQESQRGLEVVSDLCNKFSDHSEDLQDALDTLEKKLRLLQLIRVTGFAVPMFQAQLAQGDIEAVAERYALLQEALLSLGALHRAFDQLYSRLKLQIGLQLERALREGLEKYVQLRWTQVWQCASTAELSAVAEASSDATLLSCTRIEAALQRAHGQQRNSLVDQVRTLLSQVLGLERSVPASLWEPVITSMLNPLYALVEEADPVAAPGLVSDWLPRWLERFRETIALDPSPAALEALCKAVAAMPSVWRRTLASALPALLEQSLNERLAAEVVPLWREMLLLLAEVPWSPPLYHRIQSQGEQLVTLLEQHLEQAPASFQVLFEHFGEDPSESAASHPLAGATAETVPLVHRSAAPAVDALAQALYGRLVSEVWLSVQGGSPLAVAFLLLAVLGGRLLADPAIEQAHMNRYMRLRALQATHELLEHGLESTKVSALGEQLARESAVASALVTTGRKRTRARRTPSDLQPRSLDLAVPPEQIRKRVEACVRYWQRYAVVATKPFSNGSAAAG